MKFNITKKNVVILILVFSIIWCISGACGYLLWKNNLSINIDSEVTYCIGEADLTLVTQYTELTETFILSFIFTCYGLGVGSIINTFILFLFTLIRLVVDNQGYYDYRREYKIKKYKEKNARKVSKNEYKAKIKAIKDNKEPETKKEE